MTSNLDIQQDRSDPLTFLVTNPIPPMREDPELKRALWSAPFLTEDNHPTMRAHFQAIYEGAARRRLAGAGLVQWLDDNTPGWRLDGREVFVECGPVRLTMACVTHALLFKLAWVGT